MMMIYTHVLNREPMAFADPSTCSKVIMEDSMPIRIKDRNMTIPSVMIVSCKSNFEKRFSGSFHTGRKDKSRIAMRRISFLIICFCLLLWAPVASGVVDLGDIVTFGDSLTDNDLLTFYSGSPQDMYGRDPMHAVFYKASRSGTQLWKYAVAGSESDELEVQVGAYESARLFGLQDKATLFSMEIGGNDILNNIDQLAAYPPGARSSVDGIVGNIISNIRRSWHVLKASHPYARFVLWTVPDVTLTPSQWSELSEVGAANVHAHIQRANRYIRSLSSYPSVVVLDLYKIMRRFIADTPEYFGYQLIPPPGYGTYDSLFADQIHPTAVSNAVIANEIIYLMNTKWEDSIPFYTKRQLAKLAHIPYETVVIPTTSEQK
jgi:phospholipase/lecithinase/hemolysin